MIEFGIRTLAHWDARQEIPKPAILPAMLRRRTSSLTRAVAQVFGELEVGSVPLVFGSALGEIDTTISLLAMMQDGDGALSPTKFHNSVHNTATGYLGIATKNVAAASAVAAGPATVAMTLLEAALRLSPDCPEVCVLLADEPPPAPFAASGAYAALVVGLCVCTPENGQWRLRLERGPRTQGRVPPLPESLANNPCAAALKLALALSAGGDGQLCLDAGSEQEAYMATWTRGGAE